MQKYYVDTIVMFVMGLLALSTGLAFWRNSSLSMKLLTMLLVVDTVFTIAMSVLMLYRINNLFLMHIYSILAYGFIALLFSYWHSAFPKRLMRLSIPLLLVLYFLFLGVGVEVLNKPNKHTLALIGMLVAVITLYTLYSTASEEDEIPIHQQEKFWVSIGFFLSFSVTAIAAASIPVHITRQLWYLTTGLISVSYLLYLKGFLCMHKSTS